jgi:hypothetical protein
MKATNEQISPSRFAAHRFSTARRALWAPRAGRALRHPDPPPSSRWRSHGIAVHDHIIVGRDGHASLKGLRLIWRKSMVMKFAGSSP